MKDNVGVNPYSIPPLIAGILSMILGLFVFCKNPKAETNRVFAGMCASFFVWLGLYALVFSQTNDSKALFWSRNAYLGVVFIPVTVHHLCLSLSGKINRKDKALIIGSYFLSLPLIAFSQTDLFFTDVKKYFWGYYPIAGHGYWTFIVFFCFFQVRGVFCLYQTAKNPISVKQGSQIKYLAVALTIASLAAVDYLAKFGVSVYPFGYAFILINVTILAYAIVADEFLDAKLVIQKTVVYTISVVALSFVYVSVVFLFYLLFQDTMYTGNYFINSVGLILFLTLCFKPFEFTIHRFIDKKFFKGSIGEISRQRERLESELERRERLKSVGILAAGMAHEIKNPLTAIKTFADYLPEKYDDPEFREKFTRIVRAEVDRMKNIVTDLLAFSRPVEPVKRDCDVDRILADILELLSSDLMKYRITSQKVEGGQKAFADPEQIKQALLNIVLNAVESMKLNGGTLSISSAYLGGWVHVMVRDTGCGIHADKLKHIFDPFFTEKEEGTGLGLAITHAIVEKNGGRIEATSDVGTGTCFTVYLPPKPL